MSSENGNRFRLGAAALIIFELLILNASINRNKEYAKYVEIFGELSNYPTKEYRLEKGDCFWRLCKMSGLPVGDTPTYEAYVDFMKPAFKHTALKRGNGWFIEGDTVEIPCCNYE